MDYALAARSNAEEDVVELAALILCFLRGYDDLAVSGPIDDIGSAIGITLPPPIPDLVQKVRHDADLSQADQTPMFLTQDDVASGKAWGGPAPWAKPFDADDDTKTRIISRAHHEQFSEAGE